MASTGYFRCASKYTGVLAAGSIILIAGCNVSTDQYSRTVVSTPTLGQAIGGFSNRSSNPGPLRATLVAVSQGDERRVVAGRSIEIRATGTVHQIVVDGRVLATDRESDSLTIRGPYQDGRQSYVLVEEHPGGTACPSMYQALDLGGSAATVSPQFGNCSDVPRVSVESRGLRVSLPGFRAAPAANFLFATGI